MKNIKELCKIVPFEYDKYKIRLVSFSDTDWYIDNCMEAYYEEFIDNKFSNVPRKKLDIALYNIVKSYVCKVETKGEGRLLLCDKYTGEIIGGVTLFEREMNNEPILEIAYFIIPKHQGKGIAYSMLNNVIDRINKSNMKFTRIAAVIREDNIKSIHLIEKLGFNKFNITNGKYKNNIIFTKERLIS